MLKSRTVLGLLVVAATAAICATVWLITSSDTSSGETALAETPTESPTLVVSPTPRQVMPPPASTPTIDAPKPDATALAQLTQIIEHYGGNTPEPIFAGAMNGFTFVTVRPADYGMCSTGELPQIVATNPESKLVHDSGLGFDLTYVPAGYQLEDLLDGGHNTGPVIAGVCDGTAISLIETWHSPTGGQFTVSRRSGPSVIVSYISKDRLKATTLGGRPAIVVEPRYDGEGIDISLRDDHSIWGVGSKDLSMDELQQVAAGLR